MVGNGNIIRAFDSPPRVAMALALADWMRTLVHLDADAEMEIIAQHSGIVQNAMWRADVNSSIGNDRNKPIHIGVIVRLLSVPGIPAHSSIIRAALKSSPPQSYAVPFAFELLSPVHVVVHTIQAFKPVASAAHFGGTQTM